jgi:hypothetical protein
LTVLSVVSNCATGNDRTSDIVEKIENSVKRINVNISYRYFTQKGKLYKTIPDLLFSLSKVRNDERDFLYLSTNTGSAMLFKNSKSNSRHLSSYFLDSLPSFP